MTVITVNVKENEGTGAGLALSEQSQPGDWDVLVMDSIDVPRLVEVGFLAPMPAEELRTADFFPEVVMPESTQIDGETYAVTKTFGYNTISFNAANADPEDMQSLETIPTDEYAGRIALYRDYLPVVGRAAANLGFDTQALTAEDLPAIRDVLFAMKDRAATVGEVVASQMALATEEVTIMIHAFRPYRRPPRVRGPRRPRGRGRDPRRAHADHDLADLYVTDDIFDRLPPEPLRVAAPRRAGGAPDCFLRDGDMLDLGDQRLEVIHTPGHSPGGIALWEAATGILFTGDIVYGGSLIEDTYHADAADYVRSMTRLLELPMRVVHGGHYPGYDGRRHRAIVEAWLRSKGL